MRTLVILLIIVLVGWFLATHYSYVQNYWQSPFSIALPSSRASTCGLTVAEPLPNTAISYVVPVDGTIDNSQSAALGCSWTMFEGQAGQAEIVDASGNVLAGPVPISVADWTAASTTFSTQLDLTASASAGALTEGTRLTIQLLPENPSGLAQITKLAIPVVLRQ